MTASELLSNYRRRIARAYAAQELLRLLDAAEKLAEQLWPEGDDESTAKHLDVAFLDAAAARRAAASIHAECARDQHPRTPRECAIAITAYRHGLADGQAQRPASSETPE